MNQMDLASKKRGNLLEDTRGANLVEYIILVGVVALIAIAGFKAFGSNVTGKIQEQSDSVTGINGKVQ